MRRHVVVTAVLLVLAGSLSALALAASPAAVQAAPPPPAPPAIDTSEGHRHEDHVHPLDPSDEARLRTSTAEATATDARTAAAAAAGPPNVVGAWGPLTRWPVVGVHTALLPDGTVLSYDSLGDRAPEHSAVHDSTRATVWNPATGAHTRVDLPRGTFNLFCSGLAHLVDGRVLVAGGNRNARLEGIRQTHVFGTQPYRWARTPDMAFPRWYPSVTPLPNGEMLITEGGPNTPEVRAKTGRLRTLPGATLPMPLYPWLDVAPDGRVLYSGPGPSMLKLNPTGAGSWQALGTGRGSRSYGSRAVFDIGKVLVAGGAASRRDAEVIDFAGSTPTRRPTGAMASGRRQHNLTVLADGTVLATGGNSSGAPVVDLARGVYAAERWNPATGRWTTLAAQRQTRQYHSTATLLPDGRVLSAGGGLCLVCERAGYLAKDAEVFSPPYLFDATGAPAARPTITAAPRSVATGSAFTVTTPQAASIATVALVRLGASTHSTEMEQRYVPLAFTGSAGTLRVTAPAGPTIAPPGPYMLFVVDRSGVPSVASMVSVTVAPTVRLTRPTGGAVVRRRTGVHMAATAADLDGHVTRVEFFRDGISVPLAAVTGPPYSWWWKSPPIGVHTLVARATDDRGTVTTSGPVRIAVRR